MKHVVTVLMTQCLRRRLNQSGFLSALVRSTIRAFPGGLTLGLLVPVLAAAQTNATWKISSAFALKETFDNNVFLQSQTALAERESLVTTLAPQITGVWNPSPAFNSSLSYSPELSWFHSEPSEDFVLHRASLNSSGRLNHTSYEGGLTSVFINGSSTSPTWTGVGGAPAAGGPAVRDRRDAAVYRGTIRVTQEYHAWLFRPVGTLYVHDFQTDHQATPGYQNFVDRNEFTGGIDLGRRIAKATGWLGYRYGAQNQARLLQFPEEYDNTFHRILFGAEGAPVSWVKFNFCIGPEFRHYASTVPPTFGDRDRINLFVDASLAWLPTESDTVTVSIKQFQQPGFGGRSAYDDLTYDLTWRHKFSAVLTIGGGGRMYNTDFLTPVIRDDWVYSGNVFVNWSITKDLNAEISYAYESGQSKVPNTPGREYTRHLVTIGFKYTLPTWN